MKFEFNERGKKEFAEPETWAKSKKTLTLVAKVAKGVDADSLNDYERRRANRWVALGYCKRSGEMQRTTPKKSVRTSPKKPKTAVKRTLKPKPEQTGYITGNLPRTPEAALS